ncbi:hypothetical protein [Undibacterium terreum]|uniref:Uncharacterized protein n=1 Tax=Undibacterium terreum TaxID=1224302 RepID=A0A916XEN7_9BURK|nr:hypothetical protein [Undibacterium terreum]GGC66378.1 hypothetical protein GCM10011396_11790 [Undibacterium terreum]
MNPFWNQLYGLIAGGFVGGLAGFVTNRIQGRFQMGSARSSVARALRAEIGALSGRIEKEYLVRLNIEIEVLKQQRSYPSHPFRGLREHAQIFHALGPAIGNLPTALAKDVVCWYISLSIYQERSNELHELSITNSPDFIDYAIEVSELQHASFAQLVEMACPLIQKLSRY